jgi:hypothetical protein
MIYIGIDNGITGSIGIIHEEGSQFFHTPTKKELSYTKAKKWIERIDWIELKRILAQGDKVKMVGLERPLVDSTKFAATQSAMRSLEATLIILESLKLPYEYLDSKEWQKAMLPDGVKGTPELKKASLDIGKRLFPEHADEYKKDADGILIAEYVRRKYAPQ